MRFDTMWGIASLMFSRIQCEYLFWPNLPWNPQIENHASNKDEMLGCANWCLLMQIIGLIDFALSSMQIVIDRYREFLIYNYKNFFTEYIPVHLMQAHQNNNNNHSCIALSCIQIKLWANCAPRTNRVKI